MSNPNQRALFITFEGGEGAGKSTIVERLAQDLRDRGFDVVATREPGGSKLGEQIRQWLLQHQGEVVIGDCAELLLFLAARAQHVSEVIKPALAQGKIVLCDRFNDSTVAYQGVARGLGMEAVERECAFACQGVAPDVTLFLDIDPLTGLARTRKASKASASAGEVDRIEAEQIAFHEQVREALYLLEQKHPLRIRRVDASQPLQQVYEESRDIVLSALS